MTEHALLARILAQRSYRKGTFKLASGRTSDFYVDVKQTVMTSDGAALVGRLIFERLRVSNVRCVGGMAVGAVPLVAATLVAAAHAGYPLDGFFVRKEVKDHGTARRIDGRFNAGATIALVEDVVTTGESTLQAVEAVEASGGRVALVVTIVDREEDEGLQRLAARVGKAEALVTKTEVQRAAATL